ncbi:MAG: histidine ammonia-lyase, partial [Pseudomonadota bacterium]|nr:histidine ammonia-lyase [Pseudomonadota bacterium]
AIVAIELLAAAQGIEFRRPLTSSEALEQAHATIRAEVPALDQDRHFAPDLEAVKALVVAGAFNGMMPPGILPSLS